MISKFRSQFFSRLLRLLEEHEPPWFACFELQILLNATAKAFGVKGKQIWQHSSRNALREYAYFTKRCMSRLQCIDDCETGDNEKPHVTKQADSHAAKSAELLAAKSAELLAAKSAELLAAKNTELHVTKQTDLLVAKSTELHAAGNIELLAARRKKFQADRLYQAAYAIGSRIRSITGFTDIKDLKRLVFFLYRNIGITMDGCLPGEITVSGCYFGRLYTPRECALMSYMDSGIIAGLFGGGKLVFTERISEGCGRCTAHFSSLV